MAEEARQGNFGIDFGNQIQNHNQAYKSFATSVGGTDSYKLSRSL